MSEITIFAQACKGVEDCGICLFVCPKGVFESSGEMNGAGYTPPRAAHGELCTGCRNCMISCPDFAIVVIKEADDKAVEGEERDA